MKKFKTLHIYPGPIYDAEAVHKAKYEGFSKYCAGGVVSTSNVDQDYRFGDFNICLRRPKPRNGFTLFLSLLKNSLAMAKKMDSLDVVVSYDPLKTGIIGVLLKWIFNCKLIVEVNGIYDDPNLYIAGSKKIISKKKIYNAIQKFVLLRADGVKGLFPGQLDKLKINDGTVVKIFFDHTNIEPKSPTKNLNKNVLTIGFPLHIKGIDVLVKAFKLVGRDDWTLTVLGYFNENDSKVLSGLVGSAKNIKVYPPVGFSEIPKFIDGSDIFVLASRSEGMGRVLIEAAARGKARIGSNIGGIPTVIEKDVDGYLFESMNVEELAEKLSRLIESDSERARLSNKGYERFARDFSLDAYLNKYKEFYELVLK